MKSWWSETTESRSLKNQLPTAYLVLVGSWLGVRANLKRRVLNFSLLLFILNQTIYSNSGRLKRIQKQQSGHQKNRKCKDHFKSTTRRNSEGRFVVKLPFQEYAKPLGDSYQQAKKRLRSLIFRLEKQPDIYNRYNQFIQEFMDTWKKFPEKKIDKPATNFLLATSLCHQRRQQHSQTQSLIRCLSEASQRSIFKRPSHGWTLTSKGSVWNSDSFSVSSSSTSCRHCQDVPTSSTWRWRQEFLQCFVEKSKWHRTENIQNDKSDLWNSIIFVPLN